MPRSPERSESAKRQVSGYSHETWRSGRPDQAIYDACRAEERLLVTLDLDFANPFRFNPRPTAGIAVIRVPTLPGLEDLRLGVSVLINELERADVNGRLWIVERHRVLVYEPDT